MVDQWTGEWTEEKDYSKYPKEKWCDCDYMAVWIREQGYKPKTSMSILLASIFAHYDCEIEDEDSSYRIDNGNFIQKIFKKFQRGFFSLYYYNIFYYIHYSAINIYLFIVLDEKLNV